MVFPLKPQFSYGFSYGSHDPSHVTSPTRPGPREFRHDGDASTHGSHGEGETFRRRGAMEIRGAFMEKMKVFSWENP